MIAGSKIKCVHRYDNRFVRFFFDYRSDLFYPIVFTLPPAVESEITAADFTPVFGSLSRAPCE